MNNLTTYAAVIDARQFDQTLDFVVPPSLLINAVNRLNRIVPECVVVVDESDLDTVARYREAGLNALAVPPLPTLRAYGWVMAKTEKSTLCWLEAGSCILPTDCLAALLEAHLSDRPGITTLGGTPIGAEITIWDRAALQQLDVEPLASLSCPPLAILEALSQAPVISEDQNLFVRRVTVESIYGNDTSDVLPESIQLRCEADYALFDQAMRDGASSDPWKCVRSLKQLYRDRRTPTKERTMRRTRTGGRLKVLLYSSTSGFSGGEASLCQLAKELATVNVDCSAIVFRAGHLQRKLAGAGCRVFCLEREAMSFGVERLTRSIELLRAEAPDLVHFNGPESPALTALVKSWDIPIVQHCRMAELHGLGPAFSLADHVVAVSRFVQREIGKLDIPPDFVSAIHNGIDLVEFCPAAIDRRKARAAYGLPEHGKMILLIGRYTRSKRHDLAIAMFASLRSRISDVYLVMVGEVLDERSYYQDLQSEIVRRGLSGSVYTLSFHDDIRGLECAADVILQPSERDPLSRTIIEALALGIPVVAVDSGGTPELVEDSVTGLLVPPGEAQLLANAVENVIGDQDLSQRLAAGGRKWAEEHLDIRLHCDRMLDVFSHVTKGGKRCALSA